MDIFQKLTIWNMSKSPFLLNLDNKRDIKSISMLEVCTKNNLFFNVYNIWEWVKAEKGAQA